MKILGVAIVMVALLASCGDKGGKTTTGSSESTLSVAYYVQDSIAENFEFYKTNTEKLRGEEEVINEKLTELQMEGAKLAQMYEAKMAQGQLAPNGQKYYQNEIGKIQKEMQSVQESEGAVLKEKSIDFEKDLVEKMEQYSKEFAEENGYNLILTKGGLGSILYADESMDVTMDFIEYMNEQEKK